MSRLIIYLDQNMWIKLAQTILGQQGTEDYQPVMKLILEKSQSEEWIFPLSIIHHFETLSRMDDTSRMKLAKVMGEVSNNYAIIPYSFIHEVEFRNEIYKKHGMKTIDLEKEIITKDFARAVGLDGTTLQVSGIKDNLIRSQMEEFAKKLLTEHNMFYEFMAQQPDRTFVTQLQHDKATAVETFKNMREYLQKVPKQFRYKLFIGKEFIARFGQELVRLSQELGLSKEEIVPAEVFKNPESILEFLESAACFDVMTKLTFSIIEDSSRPFHRNDFNDIAFLATSIPYCNVVVTEKSWAHHIVKMRLDQKYNTKVLDNLNQIINI